MRIGMACDHGGFNLKEDLKGLLTSTGADVVDLGSFSETSVDYPDFGAELARKVSTGTLEKGILICGTGIGMSVVANKFPGVRAALANELYSARCSREHNDANVLVLGGRVVGTSLAREIVKVWLETPFSGGRHQQRLDKIRTIEKENFKSQEARQHRLEDPGLKVQEMSNDRQTPCKPRQDPSFLGRILHGYHSSCLQTIHLSPETSGSRCRQGQEDSCHRI